LTGREGGRDPHLWILAGLLAAATLLRLPGLAGDLWLDEVFSRTSFVSLPLLRILSTFTSDNQHLLYSLLAKLSLHLPIDEAAALRLPALVCGVASVWALVRLATPLVGRTSAYWAAALMTVSYHHIWFSQNARGYSGLLLATLLATDAFLRLETGGRRRDVWIYAVALAFGAGMHLLMGFVGLAHLLLAAGVVVRGDTEARPAVRRWAVGLATGVVLTLALYAPAFRQVFVFFTRPAPRVYGAAEGWTRPLWLVREALAGLSADSAAGLAVLALAGSLAVAGAVSLARRRWLAPTLFTLPAILSLITLVGLHRHLWPRFFFHFLGFGCLLLVHGATTVARRLKRPRLATALCTAMVLASLATLPHLYRLPKQDFTGARQFVEKALEEGDVAVGVGLAGEAYHSYYAPDWATARTLDELATLRARCRGRTWVVYTLPGYIAQTRPHLLRALETDYEPARVFHGTLPRGDIVVRVAPCSEERP
jgi:4-amino-4-deoxy-L-arabinose transferase-like glycosyltransferase